MTLGRPRAWAIVPACVVALGGIYAVWASYLATFAAFGRDQGIFQYVAWALQHGARDYVDVREINGPLIHLLHRAAFFVGGEDEHRFRQLDLVFSALGFLGIGALFAPLATGWLGRCLWAGAAYVVLSAHYMLYGWWDQGQRESIYALMLFLSFALQWSAHRNPTGFGPRLVVAGALGVATCFGKPTCALFVVVQLVAFWTDRELTERRRAARFYLLGTLVGCAPFAVFFATQASLGAFVRIVFGEIPTLYRYIWSKSFVECYSAWNNAPKLNYAFVTLAVLVALLALRKLPPRFSLLVGALLAGLVTFFVQHKGFPYHLHAITFATHLSWLALAIHLGEALPTTWRGRPWLLTAAGLALGAQSAVELSSSEALRAPYPALARAHGLHSREYLSFFNGGDFFALDLRDAAAYLREHTAESATVQTYGMDPYLLFLARRRSATPYIYSFELHVEAARQGQAAAGAQPAERTTLDALAARNVEGWERALRAAPPAAFVTLDKAPFTFPENAVAELAVAAPRVATWLHDNYRLAATFGVVRVFERVDTPHPL